MQACSDNQDRNWRVAVVDAMAIVHKLDTRPQTVNTMQDLANLFVNKLTDLTGDYDEVVVVFDTYIDESLKENTREKKEEMYRQ